MNAMTAISPLKGQQSSAKLAGPSKPSIVTMGGCNLLEVLNSLQDFVDNIHFWRATVPVIASAAITINDTEFEDEKVSRFLDREARKVVYNRAKAAPDSIIIIEAAADFSHNFLQLGDTLLPDIRDEVFGEGWGKISYGDNSILSSAKIISPDSDYYWDLWKYYFHRLYKELLEERLERGISVLFLSRRLCMNELQDGEFIPLKHIREIERRNRILDDVERFVAQYKGIVLIKPSPVLLYTSKYAPWGGPWEFHPETGYYADLRYKLLNAIFPGQGKGDQYLHNWIAEADKNLNGARSSSDLQKNELEVVKAEYATLMVQTSNLNAENERLRETLGFIAARYSNQKLSVVGKLMRRIALCFDAKQLRKMGFSSREYLEANPDVRVAAMNAESHFLRYGIREGRKIARTLGILLFSFTMFDFLPSSSFSNGTWDEVFSSVETESVR